MDLPNLTGRDASNLASLPAQTSVGVAPAHPPSSVGTAWGLIGLVALLVSAGLWFGQYAALPVILVCLILFFILLGMTIMGRPFGALIDARNLISLSRFQLVLWTVVVLTCFATFALARISYGVPDALKISIDPMLLSLMGISATSFVASPLILSNKKDKEPEPDTLVKTAAKSGETAEQVDDNRQGTLYANTNPADARITDMFQGDEVGNTMHVDIAKVQMFFFTLLTVVTYLADVCRIMAAVTDSDQAKTALATLPPLPSGIVVALGISHAGYLSSKGLDHTPLQK